MSLEIVSEMMRQEQNHEELPALNSSTPSSVISMNLATDVRLFFF